MASGRRAMRGLTCAAIAAVLAGPVLVGLAPSASAAAARSFAEIESPDLSVVVVAADGIDDDATASADETVDVGGSFTYTVTVTNAGAGTALDATLADTLPSGTWTVDLADPDGDDVCPVGGGPASASFACTFGALAASETKVVTLSRTEPATTGDCVAPLLNAASVSVGSGGPADPSSGNDSSSATIAVLCPLAATVTTEGPALAHRGDTVHFTFVVTNTGGGDLDTVDLILPTCDDGTVELTDDADGDPIMSNGEVWEFVCTHVVTGDDPDPFTNVATALITDVLDRFALISDEHLVDLIAPSIRVTTAVDDESPAVGDTVTFTHVVTNTGDTTLFDIVVEDGLGPVGEVAELPAGASRTFTRTMSVTESSLSRNTVTARGVDVLGKTVTDTGEATVTVTVTAVLAEVSGPATLPATGADAGSLLAVAAVLLVLGGALVLTKDGLAPVLARRRRS